MLGDIKVSSPGRPLQGNRRSRHCSRGFTLLELMIVISIMMILMGIALPLYRQHIIEAREAVLRQDLFQLNSLIEQYREDNGQSPQSLDDLVSKGYLAKLPIDPMTSKPDWTSDLEDPTTAVDPQQPGILHVHSASSETALNGEAYSTW